MSRLLKILALCSSAAAMLPLTARASVIWKGDFETGDLSQWPGHEITAPDRIQVVPNPVKEGRYAMQVTVHQGDNPISASGNRNEVFYDTDKPQEGDDRYYHWYTMWPTDFQPADTWELFTQWHQTGSGGSPPLEFFTNGSQIRVNISSVQVWTTPLELGQWHEFTVHVKWSSDAKTGYVEIWYDGALALPITHGATLFPGQGVYLKQGLYRNATVSQQQTIYHDGMTVATTLEDVQAPATATSAQTSSGSSTPPASGSSAESVGAAIRAAVK